MSRWNRVAPNLARLTPSTRSGESGARTDHKPPIYNRRDAVEKTLLRRFAKNTPLCRDQTHESRAPRIRNRDTECIAVGAGVAATLSLFMRRLARVYILISRHDRTNAP